MTARKINTKLALMGRNHSDTLQTPDGPLISLMNALPEPLNGTVWECASGAGNIVRFFERSNQPCVGTDILTGVDFLKPWPKDLEFSYIITNPPFSLKDEFLEVCYNSGAPFALLLPLTALEGVRRQTMYKKYGMQLLVLNKRPDFEFPGGVFKKKPWVPCAWFTNHFNFPSDLNFVE